MSKTHGLQLMIGVKRRGAPQQFPAVIRQVSIPVICCAFRFVRLYMNSNGISYFVTQWHAFVYNYIDAEGVLFFYLSFHWLLFLFFVSYRLFTLYLTL